MKTALWAILALVMIVGMLALMPAPTAIAATGPPSIGVMYENTTVAALLENQAVACRLVNEDVSIDYTIPPRDPKVEKGVVAVPAPKVDGATSLRNGLGAISTHTATANTAPPRRWLEVADKVGG